MWDVALIYYICVFVWCVCLFSVFYMKYLHLGFLAKLRIWHVPTQSGIIVLINNPSTHPFLAFILKLVYVFWKCSTIFFKLYLKSVVCWEILVFIWPQVRPSVAFYSIFCCNLAVINYCLFLSLLGFQGTTCISLDRPSVTVTGWDNFNIVLD